MAILRIGDRSTQVAELQQELNARPSRLPRLNIDGQFGPKTQQCVMEFQRDNGLKVDGIVGDLTRNKLRGGSAPQPTLNLGALMNELAKGLAPNEKQAFFGMAQGLVADRTLLANTLTIEAIMIIMILMLIAAMLIASSNKASQEMGRELNRKINKMRERLRSDPKEAEAVKAEALSEARQTGRDLAKRATEERQKCFDKFTPQQLEQKKQSCARALKDLSDAIQSLSQKVNTGTGGGITPENLIKGINASAQALIAALRAAADCMGCDNLNL